jgi:MFS family permease
VIQHDQPRRIATGTAYPWVVVGLLWFCGFFNYADRQALSAVFELLKGEFAISDTALGTLSSAFMLLYALTSPFTGYTVDLLSRRVLIAAGLAFWSIICAATALSRNFLQLVLFRAAEGLGESFYFPASMSVLADYHGPRTRSRAMSLHQTSVYLGTAGGWYLGGKLGELAGWRSPFWILGIAGLFYALFLGSVLIEPPRGRSRVEEGYDHPPPVEDEDSPADAAPSSLGSKLAVIIRSPAAAMLLCVFVGANFVAATFLAWLPSLVGRGFNLGLSLSALTSTIWPLASVPGAVAGGWLADRAARRSSGGRIRIQCLGLLLAAPFVLLTGWSSSVAWLMVGLLGAGFCKGIYDANIFASLYDVIPSADRGTAAGLMNTVGWAGALAAPPVVGLASERFGLGAAFAATAIVYLLVGALALVGARLADVRRTIQLGRTSEELPS